MQWLNMISDAKNASFTLFSIKTQEDRANKQPEQMTAIFNFFYFLVKDSPESGNQTQQWEWQSRYKDLLGSFWQDDLDYNLINNLIIKDVIHKLHHQSKVVTWMI